MSPWPKAPRPNHRLVIISGFPRSSNPMGSPCTQASLHTWAAHVAHARVTHQLSYSLQQSKCLIYLYRRVMILSYPMWD
ncbi:hypothetical protein GIB67_037599 [Kingdonia uniflora]|uniref:Uncharacterized protein n=1 Tax=Kingdonia uniflora TaxID=39325 RepID=A0A7J7LSD2_9MAGN|nr:hypothetical protein GIB67_037599 [Kingdonia uniflora]